MRMLTLPVSARHYFRHDQLLMPHSTMPNLPLRLKDAQDIAAFITEMKK